MVTNKKSTDSIWSPAVKITVIVAAIVLVLAIALAVVAKMGVFMNNTLAMKVGDSEVTALEFNYNYYTAINAFYTEYYSYFSFYGWDTSKPLTAQTCRLDSTKTWHEYFVDNTKSELEEVFLLVNAASAQNFQMTEDSAQQIEDYIKEAEEAAAKGKVSPDKYLRNIYGKGMTLEKYREFLNHRLLASDFYEAYIDGLTYTDDELQKYYEENKTTYDLVNYRYYEVTPENLGSDATDADKEAAKVAAKELADKIAAADTEEAFLELVKEDLISKLKEDEDKDEVDPDEETLQEGQEQSSLDKEYSEWLLNEDRKAGDTTVVETEDGEFIVLYFLSVERETYQVSNMRHILLKVTEEVDDDGTETSDDEEQKKAAENLLKEWEDGEKSEDSFAALVPDNTDDTASASNGGLYEDITKNYMVEEIDAWLWEEGRKAGDCEIVKTDYGYHIVYFVGYGDEKWSHDVTNAMQERDYKAQLEQYKATYSVEYFDRGISLVG